MNVEVFVHPQGLCESTQVGPGTRIWAFAHVMKDARIGAQNNIGEGAFVESGAVLGDRVTVKNGVYVWDGVTCEDEVFLGPACVLTNRRWPRSRQGRSVSKKPWDPILIRRGAAIGAGAVLVCPVTIGRYALVAAGAVVTKDVPDHGLVAGNPARRSGWVCECGQKLTKELVCPECKWAYTHNSSQGLVRR
jgi:acetyltransferase-like isoleucine patch superfamily enzyme